MKARLINIGNSRGVRLPKPLIEQAGLVDVVDLEVHEGRIVIAPARQPREGWAEAATRLASEPSHGLLDDPGPTRFDEDQWQW